jgi:hypothetical protein
MSPKPLCVLALLLVVLVGSSSAQRVDYSGYTEYDGRPAVLTLTFNGPVVTGNLFVSPVCEDGMHLTGVDIDLRGLAIGPWESATYPVIGNWSGGDTDPCDASSTIRNNPMYPNNGTFTIYMTKTNDGKDAVKLVRWLVRMRTSYGYLFGSKGSVYEGAGGNGSTGNGVDLVVVSVLDDPNQATAASDQLTFTMELKNLGTVEEKGFNVGFYLSPDRSITADDIYIGYGVVDLKPGESRSGPVTCKIPADITPALYYIGVIADPLKEVVESDETNNAKATEDPVRIPRSLVIFSSGSDGTGDDLASGRPGSQSAVVHLQKGQTYTFQMPAAQSAGELSFSHAGVNSISHLYGHDNFVKWGPSGVLRGDGEETLGSGTTITLLAVDEGTATVRMTAFWELSKSDGSVLQGFQDFSWTVIVGSFGSDNDTYNVPGSFSGTVSKGEITSGKIKGKAVYRPTGEPVAGATILSLDFEDEARGSYPIQKLNSDGLKTGSDGTFEIDIATCIPSGVDPGTFWIRMIKFYDGPLAQDLWGTTDLDLWVVQSPLKTFTLTNDSAQAGPIDVEIVMMDKACKVFGTECPIDPSTGLPINDPNWP